MQASVLSFNFSVPDCGVSLKNPYFRSGVVLHENLFTFLIERRSLLIKQDIPASCHTGSTISNHVPFGCINLKECSFMQNIFSSFRIQFLNPESGAVKLILKILDCKGNKIKGSICLQASFPVSDIAVIVDYFSISGI